MIENIALVWAAAVVAVASLSSGFILFSVVRASFRKSRTLGCRRQVTDWIEHNYPSQRTNRRTQILLACERRLCCMNQSDLEHAAEQLFGCPVDEIV